MKAATFGPGDLGSEPSEPSNDMTAHELASMLLDGRVIDLPTGPVSRANIMQSIWDNVDDSEQLEAAIFAAADAAEKGEHNGSAIEIQRKVIQRAALEYSEKVLPVVLEYTESEYRKNAALYGADMTVI